MVKIYILVFQKYKNIINITSTKTTFKFYTTLFQSVFFIVWLETFEPTGLSLLYFPSLITFLVLSFFQKISDTFFRINNMIEVFIRFLNFGESFISVSIDFKIRFFIKNDNSVILACLLNNEVVHIFHFA